MLLPHERYSFNVSVNKSFNLRRIKNLDCIEHVNLENEIIIAKKGKIKITVENKPYVLEKDNGIIIYPFEKHDFCHLEEGETDVIMFNNEFFDAFINSVSSGYPEKRVFTLTDNLNDYLESIAPKVNDELKVYAYLYPLFNIIKEQCTFNKEGFSTAFIDALKYINEHLTDDLSLNTIAKNIGMHPVSLSRLFAKVSNMSLNKYISFRRVNKGAEYIKKGESVIDASYLSGFGSVRNFNRSFKEYFNCTPTEYKLMNNK